MNSSILISKSLRKYSPEFRLTVIYLAFSILWILLSDSILWGLSEDDVIGGFYIVFTALILFLLAHRILNEIRKSEQALNLKQQEINLLVEEAKDYAMFIMDIEGNIVTWNAGAEQIKGYREVEVLGKNISMLYPPEAIAAGVPQRELEHVLKHGYYKVEDWRVRKDGARVFENVVTRLLKDKSGKVLGISRITRDITELKNAEEDLKSSREQLRALNLRLQTIREEESARIAREIHDELGTALTGIKLDIEWLRKKYSQGEFAPIVTQAKLQEIKSSVDSTIHSVQRISADLRPAVLDSLSLGESLEWLVMEFKKRTGIASEYLSEPEELNLDSERTIALFRILQELLTNVARHAKASQVEVNVEKTTEEFSMEVQDNGCGLSMEELKNSHSLGIVGMRERVQALGGTIQFQGANGKGTRVEVKIPLTNTL